MVDTAKVDDSKSSKAVYLKKNELRQADFAKTVEAIVGTAKEIAAFANNISNYFNK